MKQALVVLGMHRSGTSSVAGVLAKLGATPPKTLMPVHDDNPKGYWESLPLVALSERILNSAGSSWHDWRPVNPSWARSAIAESFADELTTAIEHEFDSAPLIVLKDPRICRLMPVWQKALAASGYEVRVISPLRHPLEVAASLQKRDGFCQARGLLIWLRHVLDAEAASRNLPRHIVRWSDFMADWRASVRETESRLGLAFPAQSDFVAQEITEFLDQSLRRQQGDANIPPHVPRWIGEAYDALLQLSGEGDVKTAQNVLDRVKAEFDEGAEIFGAAFVDVETDLSTWRRTTEERDHLIEVLAVTERERLAEQTRANQLQQILGTTAHERDVVAAQTSELEQAMAAQAVRNEDIARHAESLQAEISALNEAQTHLAAEHSAIIQKSDDAMHQLTLERDALVLRVRQMEQEAARPFFKKMFD
jgi:hypothetical protein